ncbi:hypothetical protein PIGHUM_02218 [Pigmentiphaga humi]|uniref:HTH luxR-type domain-containing protein n=1 Tax=Pigmentiphaga humi TaxID=2478468 RepID=A0A3P4B2N1_9BURK|nr:helix-turn-helix transcriptional regulator [Pigmentiphaga humi]VCU70151.1 hypothetical protein PIGHUM_02218 [Pigmentiphaga humi]
MDDNEHVLQLVEQLYSGILDVSRWDDALVRLSHTLGAVSSGVANMHLATRIVTFDEALAFPADLNAQFAQVQEIDPGRAAVPLLAAGKIYVDYAYHGEPNLRRMPFYSDFMHPNGLGSYTLIPMGEHDGRLFAFSVQRELGHGPLEQHDLRLMHAMLPHLCQAQTLRMQLQHKRHHADVSRGMLDSLAFPLFVCDVRGRIVQANTAASRWLDNPACPFAAGPAHVSPPVARMLRGACGLDGDRARADALTLANGDRMVVLPFAPLFEGSGADDLAMVAVQGDRWQPVPPGTLLRTLFRLTPAEIRLVQHLLRHDDALPAVAESMQLSLHTLRTQLRSVFDKTHTRRQSDLLRLLDRLGLLRQAF